MADTWELDSMDVSGVAKAPKLLFKINDDRMSFSCESDGGRIDVTALTADGKRSRIVITNTIVNEVFADLVATQVEAPSVGEDWSNPFVYAAEIGAALYWSMWRMQQIKAERVRGVLLEAVEKHKAEKPEIESFAQLNAAELAALLRAELSDSPKHLVRVDMLIERMEKLAQRAEVNRG